MERRERQRWLRLGRKLRTEWPDVYDSTVSFLENVLRVSQRMKYPLPSNNRPRTPRK